MARKNQFLSGRRLSGSQNKEATRSWPAHGSQVDLGIRVRAKAIALNPNRHNHTAAVLTLGASEAVELPEVYAALRDFYGLDLARPK